MKTLQSFLTYPQGVPTVYTIKYSKSRHYSISRDGGKFHRTNQEDIRATLGDTPYPITKAGLMLVTGQLNAAFRASTILQELRGTRTSINVPAHISRVLANIKRLTQAKVLIRANLKAMGVA